MKSHKFFLLLTLLLTLMTCRPKQGLLETEDSTTTFSDQDLVRKVRALGLHIQEISNDHQSTHVQKTYEIYVPQPIDHQDPSKGYFDQRIYLSHSDSDAPMVMYLSGYSANSNRYLSEPTLSLQANQLHVEHRFFGESKRADVPYEHLNIAQAAADHHRVVELLSQIYTGPWLSTGISKGGQTTLYHRYFYPEDVDASVVYVAPLNLALEDQRIYDFLDNVGSEECRKQVLSYQLELLLNYERCLDLFIENSALKGYQYSMSIEEAFELSIYEYGFAFWQWSADCDAIPGAEADLERKVDHLFTIDAPGFFTKQTIEDLYPFFHQSYTEMGMYGYRVSPFGELPRAFTEDFSNYRTFIPADVDLTYDGTVHRQVKDWLDTDAEDIVFVYGEYDPWSATGYTPLGDNNLFRFTVPRGNHGSRIGHLGPAGIKQYKDSLAVWLYD